MQNKLEKVVLCLGHFDITMLCAVRLAISLFQNVTLGKVLAMSLPYLKGVTCSTLHE